MVEQGSSCCICSKELHLPLELSMGVEQALDSSDPVEAPVSQGILVFVLSPDKKSFEYAIAQFFFQDKQAYVTHSCRTHKDELHQQQEIRLLKFLAHSRIQHHLPRGLLTRIFQEWSEQKSIDSVSPAFKALMVSNASRFIVIGDLHGNSKALRHILYDLCLKKVIDASGVLAPNVMVVFTGDLADRGPFGPDVWGLALQLKHLNQGKVFILRGNHEELGMAQKGDFFLQMLISTSFGCTSLAFLMNQLFESLPLGLIVGRAPQVSSDKPHDPYRFIFFCHAGFDRSVDFHTFFKQLVQEHKNKGSVETDLMVKHSSPEQSGLLWTDFCSNRSSGEAPLVGTSGRGSDVPLYNSAAVDDVFKNQICTDPETSYVFDALVRGHQHYPGIEILQKESPAKNKDWKQLPSGVAEPIRSGSVYTCTGSTKWVDRSYPELVSYGEITFDERSQQWLIRPEYLFH